MSPSVTKVGNDVLKDQIKIGGEVPTTEPTGTPHIAPSATRAWSDVNRRRRLLIVAHVIEKLIIQLRGVCNVDLLFPTPCNTVPDDGRIDFQGIHGPELLID